MTGVHRQLDRTQITPVDAIMLTDVTRLILLVSGAIPLAVGPVLYKMEKMSWIHACICPSLLPALGSDVTGCYKALKLDFAGTMDRPLEMWARIPILSLSHYFITATGKTLRQYRHWFRRQNSTYNGNKTVSSISTPPIAMELLGVTTSETCFGYLFGTSDLATFELYV